MSAIHASVSHSLFSTASQQRWNCGDLPAASSPGLASPAASSSFTASAPFSAPFSAAGACVQPVSA